jgi:hypothetical protein
MLLMRKDEICRENFGKAKESFKVFIDPYVILKASAILFYSAEELIYGNSVFQKKFWG